MIKKATERIHCTCVFGGKDMPIWDGLSKYYEENDSSMSKSMLQVIKLGLIAKGYLPEEETAK